MSNTARIAATAANTLTKPLNVEEVFSTYLYTGTASARTITNGIDLAGEGGLVWTKGRSVAYSHSLVDTERGGSSILFSNGTNSENSGDVRFSSFNSDGYSLALSAGGNFDASGEDYASWTFRKAPKFFDVVTYTGDGTSNRAISHNLGTNVGFIAVKPTSQSGDWRCFHTSLGASNYLKLNTTDAQASGTLWANTTPTNTHFYVTDQGTFGNNINGATYVAYLFAHNDGDGDFGPTGDQDIIKCGSVTLDGSGQGLVDLGFEPEWVMYKRTDGAGNWIITDSMRGWTALPNQAGAMLLANSNLAEGAYSPASYLNSSGFLISGSASQTYIYIAIRRGPMAVPESATEVFDVEVAGTSSSTPRTWNSGFPVDLSIYCHRDTYTSNKYVGTRLTGNSAYLVTNATSAESSSSNLVEFDHSDKIIENNLGSGSNKVNWMWKRAPSFFDVVAYTGNGTTGRTVSHNLGVAPEMMWVKNRTSTGSNWLVYHKDLGATKYIMLHSTSAAATASSVWNDTAPTNSVFTIGNAFAINNSGDNFINYLFASLDGVSKVSSFTSNGTDLTIDCGFTSGARFILLRDTSALGAWFVWDTERGIVAGNDPSLKLNDTTAENTSNDFVDPYSSGFIVNSSFTGTGKLWIYYAIA